MKKQLKKIYDNKSQENSLLSVKVEPVFETRGYNGTKTQTEVIEDTMGLKHKLK